MQIGTRNAGNQIINFSSAAQNRKSERMGKKTQSENRKSIFAGDLSFNKDAVTLRKQRAQKKALKIVRDSWAGEKKIDQNIADIRAKVTDLKAEVEENQELINQGESHKEALRQEYGVEADSQEQKDLELLEKAASIRLFGNESGLQFSEEEEARLNELQDPVTGAYKVPLTEYQERCLKIDGEQNGCELKIAAAETQVQAEYAAIRGIRLERLKTHDMVDAQKQAEEIMEQSGKEVIGMLIDEAKEHVDETYEEKWEEAKEKAEEKEEQEEKIEDRKEERAEQEARLEDGKEIKEMLQKMKLLEEDLKGAEVDTEL
jgi:hypothetical protein